MTEHATEKDNKPAVTITDSIVAQSLLGFDICPLKRPFYYDGVMYDCLTAGDETILVHDRIKAAVWCEDAYEALFDDALGAHMLASKCKFGVLDIDVEQDGEKFVVKSASMQEGSAMKVTPDALIESLEYQDFANATLLLRKRKESKHDENIITQCMAEFSLCPLEFPVSFKGREFDCIKLSKSVLVADRINALSWSKTKYKGENKDAIAAFLLANNCEFGVLEYESEKKQKLTIVTSAKITDCVELEPEFLVDNLAYSDFMNSTVIMGKRLA